MRLIDADAFEVFGYDSQEGTFDDGVQFVLEKIDAMPTIDAAEVKNGEWINLDTLEDCGDCAFMCSICGETYWSEDSNLVSPNDAKYCPNCGAEMSFDEV